MKTEVTFFVTVVIIFSTFLIISAKCETNTIRKIDISKNQHNFDM